MLTKPRKFCTSAALNRQFQQEKVRSVSRPGPEKEVSASDLNSDIDIKILFSKVDSPEKKQLWTYDKNKTRHKWRVFKDNQL